MPDIYIIAGPPGVGKSTTGSYYIPENLTILDPDKIAQRYREQGFKDYKDIGNLRFNELVRKELFTAKDFGIEINLGFQSHYDFVKSIKNFNSEQNIIKVVLLHTDDIKLCLQRAKVRHEKGLHLVPRETIQQMYENTIPLLKQNFSIMSSLVAIDVVGDDIDPEIKIIYERDENNLKLLDKLPNWIEKGLKDFLLSEIQKDRKIISSPSNVPTEKSQKPKRGHRPRM